MEKPTDPSLRNAPKRDRERAAAQFHRWTEKPMLALAFAWLGLLVLEYTMGLNRVLRGLGTAIWAIFLAEFGVGFVLAPGKLRYLRRNWLKAVALLAPALRVLSLARFARLARLARLARGARVLRVVASLNRAMGALGRTMQRRGFGYVVVLTALVTVGGAAGMYAFENEVPGGLTTYSTALWWTAMMITTIGSEYWPKTPEGRLLCFLLAVYGFAVFGYMAATLTSFFVGRDQEKDSTEKIRDELRKLREEIAAMRRDLAPAAPRRQRQA
jgi:voltage-gated potassium channel